MKNLILSLFFFIISFSYFSQKEYKYFYYGINKNNLYKIKKNKIKKTNKSYVFILNFDEKSFRSSGTKLQESYMGDIKSYKKENDTIYLELVSNIEGYNMSIDLIISNKFISINGFIDNRQVDFFANEYVEKVRIFK